MTMNVAVLKNRLDALAPPALFLALVWLCWQLAALLWLLVAPPKPLVINPPAPGSQLQTGVPNVSGFNLFAQPQALQPAVAAPVVADVPMRLEGTMVGQPAAASMATIRVNNESRHYRLGQAVTGTSMRLVGVAWGHVMLQRPDGSLARLRFGQQGVDNPQQPAVGAVPVAPVAPVALSPAQQVDQALDEARNQLQTNPAAYLQRMGVAATANGYEVTEQLPADLRAQVGLRPGDRVVSINGQRLGQPQQDALLIDQVKQQRRVQIEIQRGSQTMTIQQSF